MSDLEVVVRDAPATGMALRCKLQSDLDFFATPQQNWWVNLEFSGEKLGRFSGPKLES